MSRGERGIIFSLLKFSLMVTFSDALKLYQDLMMIDFMWGWDTLIVE